MISGAFIVCPSANGNKEAIAAERRQPSRRNLQILIPEGVIGEADKEGVVSGILESVSSARVEAEEGF